MSLVPARLSAVAIEYRSVLRLGVLALLLLLAACQPGDGGGY
jgi:hypothetical protein